MVTEGGATNREIDCNNRYYEHIVRVILGAAVNSPIDLVLRADNVTNLGMLWVFIHSPGLIRRLHSRRWILSEEQYHDLLSLDYYIMWNLNRYAMFRIVNNAREDFKEFIQHTHYKGKSEFWSSKSVTKAMNTREIRQLEHEPGEDCDARIYGSSLRIHYWKFYRNPEWIHTVMGYPRPKWLVPRQPIDDIPVVIPPTLPRFPHGVRTLSPTNVEESPPRLGSGLPPSHEVVESNLTPAERTRAEEDVELQESNGRREHQRLEQRHRWECDHHQRMNSSWANLSKEEMEKIILSKEEMEKITSGIRRVHMTIQYWGGVYPDSATYYVSSAERRLEFMSLVDRGANGGICGDDMKVISYSGRTIDVQGIDNHELPQLRICTCGGVVRTQRGHVLLIFHQYAYHGRGKSIHSSLQLEDNQVTVNDRAATLNGAQSLVTNDGYAIPLDFRNGLPYLNIRPFTDDELTTLPQVIMTRDITWSPSQYDSRPSEDPNWFNNQDDPPPLHEGFDFNGEAIFANSSESGPSLLSHLRHDALIMNNLNSDVHETTIPPVDASQHRRFFLNQPNAAISHTFNCTTRFYVTLPSHRHMHDTRRTQFPAANVHRRNEMVATDTIFCDVIAWGGIKCSQMFVGRKSKYVSHSPCNTDAEFAKTLSDEIRQRGAMDTLISDRAQAEISNRIKDILRIYVIKDRQSEPHFQHQNYAERGYQEVKKHTNWVLNYSGCPLEAWVHVIDYVLFIMNRTARKSLGWRTPYEALYGQTPDISILLHFEFWEKCLIKNYQSNGSNFPSQSNEIEVRFLGYAENVGHSMTFKVYNELTKTVLYRSVVKKVQDDLDRNRRVMSDDGNNDNAPSPNDPSSPSRVVLGSDNTRRYAGFDPESLVGRTFLMNPQEDGSVKRAKIVECLEEHENETERHPERKRFRCEVGDDEFEKYLSYSDMCNFIEEQEQNENGTWNFRNIMDHRAVKTGRRTKHQVLIEWESGERSWEDISSIYTTNKYILLEYAMEHDLVSLWDNRRMKLKELEANSQNMLRLINKAKLKSRHGAPVYMYGHEVPRGHREAVELDKKNGDRKWQDSEELETSQLMDYEVFEDRGHISDPSSEPPSEYKKIPYHVVFAVKHDERYKSRLVAGGHMTDAPIGSVYSGVVSLRGVRLVVFLAELNGLKIWQTDVGNAYLEAETKEKVYVIAGPEFGKLEGHVFIIKKALYGLKSSGLRWHERFIATS